MGKLSSKPQIIALARDLRIPASDSPDRAIITFCIRKLRRMTNEYPCRTLDELLAAGEAALKTRFIEIHTDAELEAVKQQYISRGEVRFGCLDQDLNHRVFAITLKLINPKSWERPYVSVIDGRGNKSARSYFSRWHELAHLLTQTDQRRLVFTRTHAPSEIMDAEEVLMEQIAGTLGFLPEIVRPHITGEISFEEIERLRGTLCPSASQQSSFIGFIKAWPRPALYLEAKIALRKSEQRARRYQRSFSFQEHFLGDVRAVMVVPNDEAIACGLSIFPNMRVPADSVIMRVFNGDTEYAEAVESLDTWESRDGTVLPAIRVRTKARRAFEGVRALMVPF
jgi:hypothetical protein